MNRLEAIASLVPSDATCVADLGYDHGRLIELLAGSCPGARLVGVEKQTEAAANFQRRIRRLEDQAARICLLHGDGLAPLEFLDVDILVVAGLGEYSIVEILKRSPGVVSRFRRMVFCPEKPRSFLRPFLHSIGWAAVEERPTQDRGRLYHPFAAEPVGL